MASFSERQEVGLAAASASDEIIMDKPCERRAEQKFLAVVFHGTCLFDRPRFADDAGTGRGIQTD
jgi:hypothetical protein